jgi:hypothetical protein
MSWLAPGHETVADIHPEAEEIYCVVGGLPAGQKVASVEMAGYTMAIVIRVTWASVYCKRVPACRTAWSLGRRAQRRERRC